MVRVEAHLPLLQVRFLFVPAFKSSKAKPEMALPFL